jgi:hypothetical protein
MNLSSPLVIIAVCHVIARLSGDWLTGLAWLPAQAAYWILLGAMGESNDGVPRAIGQLHSRRPAEPGLPKHLLAPAPGSGRIGGEA